MEDSRKDDNDLEIAEDWRDGKNLKHCVLKMFLKGLWTDIAFRCMDHDEGEVIKAHKTVLAARSPVFEAMFFGPCATNNDVVEVRDKKKEIFHLVIEYIYSDSVLLKEDTVLAVLETAHFYQLAGLVQLCSDFLTTILTSDNVCEILTLAMFYKLRTLTDACCSFIDNHAREVIQTEGFLDLPEDCLLYILKGDTLYAKEEDILEAVEEWARRKLGGKEKNVHATDIRKFLGGSFYFLRLPAMSSQVLRESVSRKGYFSIEEYADIAAFASNVENVSISTNSCIARVPENETINLNNQDGDTIFSKHHQVSFEITLLKSASLSGLVFGKIYPQMVNTRRIYTDEGHGTAFLGEVRRGYVLEKRTVYQLQRLKLPDNLFLNLSGSVSVHGIEGEQEFNVKQMNVEETEINLTKPILLEKRRTPYVVLVNIRYSSSNELELETRCSINKDPVISGTKIINVKCTKGSFAGIKSIKFKHISNRNN